MTDTEHLLIAAARSAVDDLGRWADLEQPLSLRDQRAALKAWRCARESIAHALRWTDAEDAEVYEATADLAEALGACEYALKFGSAAPVASTVEAALWPVLTAAAPLSMSTTPDGRRAPAGPPTRSRRLRRCSPCARRSRRTRPIATPGSRRCWLSSSGFASGRPGRPRYGPLRQARARAHPGPLRLPRLLGVRQRDPQPLHRP